MKNLILILGLLAIGWSCSPDPAEDLSIEDTDLVITRQDTGHNYSNDQLYAIFDQVLELREDTILLSDSALDRALIQRVKENLNDFGYLESVDSSGAADTTNPNLDVVIILTKFQQENSGAVNGGYWYGYPGYWNPWYVGYPGLGWYYPGYTYVYSYETGSVIVAMFDWSERAEEIQFPVWEAGLRGVLSGRSSTNADRALWGVDQAFKQSPYLNKN